jgi:hypothetical protein
MGRINVADATPKQVMQDLDKLITVTKKFQIDVRASVLQSLWENYSVEHEKSWLRLDTLTNEEIRDIILAKL